MEERSPSDSPNLAGQLPGWIEEARALAQRLAAAQLLDELDLLAAQRDRSHLRLAVVGEFNRGKSTLVNRLVDTTLLPTGPVPTTRALVAVGFADPPTLTIQWSDGVVETRDDPTGFWTGLAGEPDVEDGPSVDELKLGVPSTWLRDLGIEILDTPGANEELDDERSDVRRALARSDAALLVVSATSPVSRTERTLLEEEILRRRVPLVAVVVALLDQLAPEDRDAALGVIEDRIQRIAPAAAVLSGPGLEGGADELAALREQVIRLPEESVGQHWRARKDAFTVAEVGDAIADVAGLAAETAERAEEERRASAAREGAALARDTAIWNEVRADLEARRRTLVQRIRESLSVQRRSLVEGLRDELRGAEDPSAYWERELRPSLRSRLLELTEKTEAAVVDGLTEDVTWLDTALADRLGVTASSVPPARAELIAPHLPAQGRVGDLGLARVLTIVGAPLGKILADLFSGVAKLTTANSVAIRAAGERLGDYIATNAVEAATTRIRHAVDAQLDPLVHDTLDRFTDDVAVRLDRLYNGMVDELARKRAAWRAARTAVMAGEAPEPGDRPDHGRTAADAADLASRIRLALDDDTTPESR